MDTRSQSTVWSMIKKFDGKNYKSWAYNMKLLLNRERCKGIVDRWEVPPAGPTAAVPAELDEAGKPISGTGCAGSAASQAFTDYTFRFWEALRLIYQSLEENIQSNYMSIEHPADLWDAIKRDYVEKLQRGQYYVRNDLIAVKLEDCGSVDAYVTKIQNLLDQYKLGSQDNDSLGVKEHVFYIIHSIPEGGDWDVVLRFIHDKLEAEGWNKEPAKIIKLLQNREAELRKMKGIASDVLLYTKTAMTSSKETSKGKADAKKDKAKQVCTNCKEEGHLEENCWIKHGKPGSKRGKKDKDDAESEKTSANVTASSGSSSADHLSVVSDPDPADPCAGLRRYWLREDNGF
jgi:hypothetical protein